MKSEWEGPIHFSIMISTVETFPSNPDKEHMALTDWGHSQCHKPI